MLQKDDCAGHKGRREKLLSKRQVKSNGGPDYEKFKQVFFQRMFWIQKYSVKGESLSQKYYM